MVPARRLPPQAGPLRKPHIRVDVRLALHSIGTPGFDATGGVSRRCRAQPGKRSEGAALKDSLRSQAPRLSPRHPEPHANGYSTESRQRVATTRCSGHRCCDSDPEDRPGIVVESQQDSQQLTTRGPLKGAQAWSSFTVRRPHASSHSSPPERSVAAYSMWITRRCAGLFAGDEA